MGSRDSLYLITFLLIEDPQLLSNLTINFLLNLNTSVQWLTLIDLLDNLELSSEEVQRMTITNEDLSIFVQLNDGEERALIALEFISNLGLVLLNSCLYVLDLASFLD